jgi:arylsulfatase A-like enzyme
MLGNHGQYAKSIFFEDSAKIPFIVVPTAEDPHGVGHHREDERLTEIRDMMPTLLEMCDIPVPDTVEGISILSDQRREYLFGEHNEGLTANRMLRDDRYKLIYYPTGNRFHLFDMVEDPNEMHDLSNDPAYQEVKERLERELITYLHDGDEEWAEGDHLVGVPDQTYERRPNRSLNGQRGWHFM